MGVYISDNPFSYLSPPVIGPAGDFANQLRSKAGFIIGTVDGFIHACAGFSPLAEWVTKPFSGDWDAMGRAASSWRSSGDAIDATKRSINALPGQVGSDWNGESYDTWERLQQRLSDAIGPLPEACLSMGEFADALADMARSIAEYIAEVLGIIADTATRILLEQFVPIVGQITGAAETAILATRTAIFGTRICKLIDRFYKAVQTVKSTIEKIQKVISALTLIANALTAAAKANTAANNASSSSQQSNSSAFAGASAGGGGGGGGY